MATSLALREGLSLERVALELGRSPRTASTWGPSRVGMPWREVIRLGNWEAVCEAGLRRLGKASEDAPPLRAQRVSGEFWSVEPPDEDDNGKA